MKNDMVDSGGSKDDSLASAAAVMLVQAFHMNNRSTKQEENLCINETIMSNNCVVEVSHPTSDGSTDSHTAICTVAHDPTSPGTYSLSAKNTHHQETENIDVADDKFGENGARNIDDSHISSEGLSMVSTMQPVRKLFDSDSTLDKNVRNMEEIHLNTNQNSTQRNAPEVQVNLKEQEVELFGEILSDDELPQSPHELSENVHDKSSDNSTDQITQSCPTPSTYTTLNPKRLITSSNHSSPFKSVVDLKSISARCVVDTEPSSSEIDIETELSPAKNVFISSRTKNVVDTDPSSSKSDIETELSPAKNVVDAEPSSSKSDIETELSPAKNVVDAEPSSSKSDIETETSPVENLIDISSSANNVVYISSPAKNVANISSAAKHVMVHFPPAETVGDQSLPYVKIVPDTHLNRVRNLSCLPANGNNVVSSLKLKQTSSRAIVERNVSPSLYVMPECSPIKNGIQNHCSSVKNITPSTISFFDSLKSPHKSPNKSIVLSYLAHVRNKELSNRTTETVSSESQVETTKLHSHQDKTLTSPCKKPMKNVLSKQLSISDENSPPTPVKYVITPSCHSVSGSTSSFENVAPNGSSLFAGHLMSEKAQLLYDDTNSHLLVCETKDHTRKLKKRKEKKWKKSKKNKSIAKIPDSDYSIDTSLDSHNGETYNLELPVECPESMSYKIDTVKTKVCSAEEGKKHKKRESKRKKKCKRNLELNLSEKIIKDHKNYPYKSKLSMGTTLPDSAISLSKKIGTVFGTPTINKKMVEKNPNAIDSPLHKKKSHCKWQQSFVRNKNKSFFLSSSKESTEIVMPSMPQNVPNKCEQGSSKNLHGAAVNSVPKLDDQRTNKYSLSQYFARSSNRPPKRDSTEVVLNNIGVMDELIFDQRIESSVQETDDQLLDEESLKTVPVRRNETLAEMKIHSPKSAKLLLNDKDRLKAYVGIFKQDVYDTKKRPIEWQVIKSFPLQPGTDQRTESHIEVPQSTSFKLYPNVKKAHLMAGRQANSSSVAAFDERTRNPSPNRQGLQTNSITRNTVLKPCPVLSRDPRLKGEPSSVLKVSNSSNNAAYDTMLNIVKSVSSKTISKRIPKIKSSQKKTRDSVNFKHTALDSLLGMIKPKTKGDSNMEPTNITHSLYNVLLGQTLGTTSEKQKLGIDKSECLEREQKHIILSPNQTLLEAIDNIDDMNSNIESTIDSSLNIDEHATDGDMSNIKDGCRGAGESRLTHTLEQDKADGDDTSDLFNICVVGETEESDVYDSPCEDIYDINMPFLSQSTPDKDVKPDKVTYKEDIKMNHVDITDENRLLNPQTKDGPYDSPDTTHQDYVSDLRLHLGSDTCISDVEGHDEDLDYVMLHATDDASNIFVGDTDTRVSSTKDVEQENIKADKTPKHDMAEQAITKFRHNDHVTKQGCTVKHDDTLEEGEVASDDEDVLQESVRLSSKHGFKRTGSSSDVKRRVKRAKNSSSISARTSTVRQSPRLKNKYLSEYNRDGMTCRKSLDLDDSRSSKSLRKTSPRKHNRHSSSKSPTRSARNPNRNRERTSSSKRRSNSRHWTK